MIMFVIMFVLMDNPVKLKSYWLNKSFFIDSKTSKYKTT